MRLPERLPDLRGRWLTAYKALWWVVLAASVVGLVAGQWPNLREPSAAEPGVITAVSETIDALIVLAGAIVLFWRRPSDPVAALLSLGLLAVPANQVAYLVPHPVLRSLLDNGIDVIPMVCILLGMTVFPSGRFEPRWTLLIVPAMALWATMLFAEADLPTPAVLALVLPALVITVASLVTRYVRMAQGTPRQQVKWVMLGFAGFFACGLIELALVTAEESAGGEGARFALFLAREMMTPLEGLCLVGGLLVSLLRYRLYDADAAISRSTVYAALTVLLFGVFAASETLIQTLSQKWIGAGSSAVGGAVAAALAASLLVPLHHRLNDWAKQRFQRDLSRLRAELPEVLIAIRDSSNPDELADDALKLAMRGVHASHGAMLLADAGRLRVAHAEGMAANGLAERLGAELPAEPSPGALRTSDADAPLCLPLIAPDATLVGWLALGPHPDGSFYGKDDRKALEELAPPLARALSQAMTRARREQEREAERRTLTERLAQLENTLAQAITPPRPAGAA
jgi:hypothetical protein